MFLPFPLHQRWRERDVRSQLDTKAPRPYADAMNAPGTSIPPGYCGRILREDFSPVLKTFVTDCLFHLNALEQARALGINYVSAWKLGAEGIWYEFVSKAFCQIFQCEPSEVAENFRSCMRERRGYRYSDLSPGLQKQILNARELERIRQELREEARVTGTLQATYRLGLKDGRTIWLKDEARIGIHEEDRLCLSFGRLMDVTKEMEII